MTNQLHKLVLLVVAAIFTGNAYAYDAQINGIYYNLDTESKTASVTSGDSFYTGEMVIPVSVTHDGNAYSVTSIGLQAFYGCSELTSIYIPSSVTSIDYGAFTKCSGLTAISVSSDNPAYCTFDGILYDKDKTTLILWYGLFFVTLH